MPCIHFLPLGAHDSSTEQTPRSSVCTLSLLLDTFHPGAQQFQAKNLKELDLILYPGRSDADHFGGKLHLGFIQIREKLDQLRVC